VTDPHPNQMERAQLVEHVLELRTRIADLERQVAHPSELQVTLDIVGGLRCPRCGNDKPRAPFDLCDSCETAVQQQLRAAESRT
jgi:hypothetical protein